MGHDDRIRFVVREEMDRAAADLGPGELAEGEGWSGRLDDLHTEIHVLATRVSLLEARLKAAYPPPVPEEPAAAPAASRTRRGAEK